jgi:hypothetical protein
MSTMERHHALWGMVITLFVFLIIIPSTYYLSLRIKTARAFVTSEYSKYCYPNGRENKNIKEKIYHESLESCGKPIKI